MSDSNEFEPRSIVMWNGNEDKEEMKEVFEKSEVIKGIRWNGGQFVGIQDSNRRSLNEGGLWNEWKEQKGETVESIENTRREGGDGVGVKLNERGN